MEEKDLKQENQELTEDTKEETQQETPESQVATEKQEAAAEDDAGTGSVSEEKEAQKAESEAEAGKNAEEETQAEPQEETSAKMPEEVIKKLQTEPLHRKKGGGSKKVLQGMVFSNKADKTIVIRIENQVAHPLYKKYYKSSKKIMAHDENNDCNIGDVVRVKECRPLSARKRWILTDIISRAK